MKELYRIMRKRNRARIGWMFLLAFAAYVTAGGWGCEWIFIGAFTATAIRAQEYIDIGVQRGYPRKKKFSLIEMRVESAFWYLDNGTTLGDVMRMHSFVPGEYFLNAYLGMLPGIVLAAGLAAAGAYWTEREVVYTAISVGLILVVPFVVMQLFRVSVYFCMRHEPSALQAPKTLSIVAVRLMALVCAVGFSFAIAEMPQPIRHAIYGVRKGDNAIVWHKYSITAFLYAIFLALFIMIIMKYGARIWSLVALVVLAWITISVMTSYAVVKNDTLTVYYFQGVEGQSSYRIPEDVAACKFETTGRTKNDKIGIKFELTMKNGTVFMLGDTGFLFDEDYTATSVLENDTATGSNRKYSSIWQYASALADRLLAVGVPCTFVNEKDDAEKYQYSLDGWSYDAYKHLLELFKPAEEEN